LQKIKAVPGVEEATGMDTLPLTGGGRGNYVWLEGRNPDDRIPCSFNRVGADYFKTLQIPLVSGRPFSGSDAPNTPKAAIINQTLAGMLKESNPVGRRFVVEVTPFEPETAYEIVGVARDHKFEDLREEPIPVVYLASSQDPAPSTGRQFLIRSTLPPADLTTSVSRSLMEVNSGMDISFQGFRSMVQESLLRERLMAMLSGVFGALALLLASIGLYGLLSYGVASRINEIGIRMTLGAGTRSVLSLILKEAIVLVLIGIGVGVPLVLLVAGFATTLLFQLSPTDPVSVVAASGVLLFVAILAGYIPARRATKVDPLVALRYE
ncbi:MAG TPA: FtsX-like permease family protein, partial [Pyrinomonadaceae bacterium]